MKAFVIFLIHALLIHPASVLADSSCTTQSAFARFAVLNKLTAQNSPNWTNEFLTLYQGLSKEGCDDGAYAEGMSDVICQHLGKRWESSKALFEKMDHDPNLSQTVISHIDGTADWNDLEKIAVHARKNCPKDHEPMCRKILEKAKTALKQSKKEHRK